MNSESWKTTAAFKEAVMDSFTELMLADMMTMFSLLRNHASAIHGVTGKVQDMEMSINNIAALSKRAASMAVSKKLSPDALKKLMETSDRPTHSPPAIKDARVPSAN